MFNVLGDCCWIEASFKAVISSVGSGDTCESDSRIEEGTTDAGEVEEHVVSRAFSVINRMVRYESCGWYAVP